MENQEDLTLIVDDDESILKLLQKYFSKKGYSVITAHNGKDALKQYSSNNISRIISDLKMPEMGGDDLLEEIRKDNPNLPVFIMTGFPDSEKIDRLNSLGVTEIFLKPINLIDFEKRIFSFSNI